MAVYAHANPPGRQLPASMLLAAEFNALMYSYCCGPHMAICLNSS
eukprot:CAMPEP_0202874766 /NCGR_PEP_ID=MMETSP1391-20130828/25994_1 /ASSEMBLY_ACC=CAM_ASM_000867 /TAXON_ID=1034604 /ORGANISM="Chlamydomonas leiostraca, Strain SAG 11-49" /LENGTH=44 /DNA_ID= /DNA_START= /DNA_END= /DNA_ORIENTATION=